MAPNKKYDFQDRLIAFAGDVILMVASMPKNLAGKYLFDQIMRSSGSSALNFGETQGTGSTRDYLAKARISLKELRETEVNLRIMRHVKYGDQERERLHAENIELIKILTTIIKNRQE